MYFNLNTLRSTSCNKYTIPNALDTKYAIPIKKYANRNTKYVNQMVNTTFQSKEYAEQNTKYANRKKERQPRHQLHHMFIKYTIQNIEYSSKLVYAVLSYGNFVANFCTFRGTIYR